MKKRWTLVFATVLTLALVLGSCGAKTDYAANESWSGGTAAAGDSYDSDMSWDAGATDPGESWDESGSNSWDGVMDSVGNAVEPQTSFTEKIIYSADVTIETVEFDKAVESVEAMLTKYGAFLESSEVSGKSYRETYYGSQTYRWASFIIRVPVTSFKDMTQEMENVGSVTNSRVYTDNITTQYYDTQSRVDAYRIEQERLLAMLEKCETVADMIEIESRLSDVRYQLESLESTLRNWQNRVDYSTVNVTLNEVQEYTKQVEIHRTYWQEIGDGLKESLENIGDFFKDLFKGFVVSLPAILLFCAFGVIVAVIVIAIIRKAAGKRRRAAMETRRDENNGADGEK